MQRLQTGQTPPPAAAQGGQPIAYEPSAHQAPPSPNAAPQAQYAQQAPYAQQQARAQMQRQPHQPSRAPAPRMSVPADPQHSMTAPIAPRQEKGGLLSKFLKKPKGLTQRQSRSRPVQQNFKAPPIQNLGRKASALKNTGRGFSNTSLRFISFLAIAFLLAFLLLAANSIRNENNTASKLESNLLETQMRSQRSAVANTITSQVKWMETAQALRGSASQIVNVAARAPNVTGVAMLDSSGKILAHYPQAATALGQISLADFPQSGVNITAMMSQGGIANPVIIRRSDDNFLASMLAPGSLIGTENLNSHIALLAPGGNVIIDGANSISTNGVLASFGVSQSQLLSLTTQAENISLNKVESASQMAYLAAAKIDNTDLTLLKGAPKGVVDLPSNFFLFMVLFLCTAALVLGLMRVARRQIKTIEDTYQINQISQERYRIAVESGRGGVWEIDLKDNSVFLNNSLSALLGLAKKEQTLTISQFLALFQEADRERLLAVARRAHLQGEMDIELRVAHLPLVMQCRGKYTIREQNNGGKVIVGVAIDITEQRGAQARLQAAETRLFDALNSMSDSFVVWDALGRIVLWNGKFANFFGLRQGQLQQGLEENIVEQIASAAIEDVFDVENEEDHVEIKLKDGRWIRYMGAETADGGKVSIGTDITELRQREQDLRDNDSALRKTVDVLKKSQSRIMELADNYEQEKIRAEDANQSKSDFLANMSHELRTPLNAINGFSDIMKKEMFGPLGDPRYKEYVSDILFSGQHLLSLINDILDMSKIEAGKMTLNTDLLQINEMISQVVRIVRGRAEDKRLKLLYDGIDFEEIEADQRAVKQVLLNLITNAIKFTPEGGTVKVHAERKSAGVIIRVTDSGIGISQENIERLAKPFEQIETTNSKQQEGTGLGLALSKSLIELHGGNFLMESELGVGTTVTFTLPNSPAISETESSDSEVGTEINRLAQDIADVLDQSQSLPPVSSPASPPVSQQVIGQTMVQAPAPVQVQAQRPTQAQNMQPPAHIPLQQVSGQQVSGQQAYGQQAPIAAAAAAPVSTPQPMPYPSAPKPDQIAS